MSDQMGTAPRMDPINAFKSAVESRNPGALRTALAASDAARRAINEPLFSFDSPALVAAARDADVVEVLLEFGADPNKKSNWWAGGFHPLYNASPAAAKKLLAAGARRDTCAAAKLDDRALLTSMIAANPQCVHERGGDGQTPLHFAQSRGAIDILLAAGADIDARCLDHRSSAAEWMLGERTDLSRYLVERGAHADIFMAVALGLGDRVTSLVSGNAALLSQRTTHGAYAEKPPSSYHIYMWTIGASMTPFQVASKFKERASIEALRPFATTQQRLLLACDVGDKREALEIVKANPRLIASLDADGRGALADAAWNSNARAVELMLELGFDPAASGRAGASALHCAAWEGSVACVRAILARPKGRALLTARDATYGGTPLNWCDHRVANVPVGPNADHAVVRALLVEASE